MSIYNRWIGSVLQMNQTATSIPKGASASNNLNFMQHIVTSPKYISAINRLVFKSTVLGIDAEINMSASNMFFIFDHATRQWDQHIFQTFFPYQNALANSPLADFGNAISFMQEVEVESSKGAKNIISFGHEVAVNIVKNLSVSHTLIFQSHGAAYLPSDAFIAIDISFPTPPSGDGHCDS